MRQGKTPDQAIYLYLHATGKTSFIPPLARSFARPYLTEIREILGFFASPEGSAWLRQGKNLENLFSYLVRLLE
jgi:hypothetical protein